MSSPDFVRYVFVWHAMGDACPQCAMLNGQTFTDQDIFQSTLWSPFYGDVWSLDMGRPLTHGGTGINCRCQLEVRVIFDWDRIRGLRQVEAVLAGIY